MKTLWQDVRYAGRMLAKHPGFTAISIITLALGIGANTAIFSIVHPVMLRPLPYENPDQLVMVWQTSVRGKDRPSPAAPAVFLDWREQNEVFTDMAAYEDAAISHRPRFNLTGDGAPERVWGARASVNLFALLGVEAAQGRTFLPEEEEAGRDRVVLISDGLWRRRFGADPNLVGKELGLNNKSYTVVGIMPPNFKLSYPRPTDLLIPLPLEAAQRSSRLEVAYKVIARLKPAVTLEQAGAGMDVVAQALGRQYPDTDEGRGVSIVPLHEEIFGATRTPFVILAAAVAFVLLIACVNVVNLLLARATERAREMSVRAALGASRLRLIQQLLTESVLLSTIGGALGLLLAVWGIDLLVTLIPQSVPRAGEVTIDGWVLGFTCLVSIITGVFFGVLPALQASKPNLSESLKKGTRSATASLRSRDLRGLLVISEVALALVLLAAAGLMIKSLWRLQQVELGFEPENVLTMKITLPGYKYPEERQTTVFVEQLLERVRTLPGVRQASTTTAIPVREGGYTATFEVEGRPRSPAGGNLAARWDVIDADYFRTMGVPLLKGRHFSEQDREGSPNVAIISETMARQFFPGEDPIGRRLVINTGEEIVGVVGDVRRAGLGKPTEAAMYTPLPQSPMDPISLVVRTASDPAKLAAAIQREVWAIDKDQPIEAVSTMEEIVDAAIADTRFYTLVLGAFASVALVLGTVGIYGVVAYAVAQRTHEIGIRMALGAGRGNVIRLVVGQGMLLTLIGVVVGLVSALALTRVITSLLYGVSATDPVTFAGVAMLLTAVALLACYIPARRATKADPMVALRHE